MDEVRTRRWLGPLALGFLVTIVLGLGVVSPQNQPGQNAAGTEVVTFFRDNGTRAWAGFYLVAVALALLAFLVSGLSHALRETNEARSWLSTVVFAGGMIMVIGFAVTGVDRVALIEAANNNRPDVASQLNFVDQQMPVASTLGVFVLMLAVGAVILTGSVLPRWLGVGSVVIAACATLGGLGFIALLATPIWLSILGFKLDGLSAGGAEADVANPSRHGRGHRLTLRHH